MSQPNASSGQHARMPNCERSCGGCCGSGNTQSKQQKATIAKHQATICSKVRRQMMERNPDTEWAFSEYPYTVNGQMLCEILDGQLVLW